MMWLIEDGPDEQSQALVAFFAANAGDTIEFGDGAFELDTTLVMAHKEGITIRGQGTDRTVLDFLGSFSPEGLSLSHMDGITIEDLTIIDTPGLLAQGLRLRPRRAAEPARDVVERGHQPERRRRRPRRHGPARPVDPRRHLPARAVVPAERPRTYVDVNGVTRTYVTDSGNGGYAIYPVLSNDVLLDDVVAVGASDAGIYVGQSNDIIVKNSEALMNVAGFEIENSDDADMFDNVAHCNTGGFLTFDLPGLNQYGDETRAFNNYSGLQQHPELRAGRRRDRRPAGRRLRSSSATTRLEIFGNTIEFNRTRRLRRREPRAARRQHRQSRQAHGPLPRGHLRPRQHLHDERHLAAAAGGGRHRLRPRHRRLDDRPPVRPDRHQRRDHDSLLPGADPDQGHARGRRLRPDRRAHRVGRHVRRGRVRLRPRARARGIVDANGKPQYTGAHQPACRYNAYKFADPGEPGDAPASRSTGCASPTPATRTATRSRPTAGSSSTSRTPTRPIRR